MTNQMFSQKERDYLKSQRLARIATATSSIQQGTVQPDVVPVGFDFDGEYLYVGGMNLLKSTKYRNVLINDRVAIIVDDLKTVNPWDPRGIRIYGTADIVTRNGGYMESKDHPNPQYIRITPKRKWSWGIEEPVFVKGKFSVKRAQAG
ncbi:MAG: PPOX class F420-dependent oxidoreductase [Nitrososphaeraceae archaeon]